MNTALMFSHAKDEWTTPQDFYDGLHAEFGFQIDAAATRQTNKCSAYYGLDKGGLSSKPCYGDALAAAWFGGPHWCNPPYSRAWEFVAKAAEERQRGILTVMLVASRTDVIAFHKHLWDAQTHHPRPGIEIRFVKGRLKFGGAENGAPFPSMVVVFRPE